MTDASAVRREMRANIDGNCHLHPGIEAKEDDDYLALEIVGTGGFVELMEEVQSRYRVTVEDVEIADEGFRSIDTIRDYVERERSTA